MIRDTDTDTDTGTGMSPTDEGPCPYEQLAREAWESSKEYDGTPWDETDPVERELKEKKKELVVMALADDSPYGMSAVAHAVAVSMIFHAELSILPLSPKTAEEDEQLRHSMHIAERQGISVTWHPYDPQLRRKLPAVAESINAMMMVMGVAPSRKSGFFTRRKALRWIRNSRIPVLAVSGQLPRPDAYRNILLPMDTSVYAKEKALWAGYFHRFYHADIHLIYKNYKDSYLEQKLKANLRFTEKIYHNLEIPCTHHAIADCWEEIEQYALRFAPEVRGSLMVCMTTRYPTPADWIFGRKEQRLLRKADGFPLLLINQRDDLYVLCT
jgi:hypothetical protein